MAVFSLRSLAFAQLLWLVPHANAYSHAVQELHARQDLPQGVAPAFDYIVVGGGQSGLVVASRLSEDPRKSVLIVEYGDFENDPAQLEPWSTGRYKPSTIFNLTVQPQVALKNRSPATFSASVVGGGSTINGMYFDRGSASDYNTWEKVGNPGWGWKGLLPYFKKSATFTPPSPELTAEYNITWDIESAYGNGPIQATIPDWQYPGVKIQWKVWEELGMPIQKEGAGGNAFGAFWVHTVVNQTYHRSYSRNAYFEPASSRPNLKILVRHRVNEVLFDKHKRATGVSIQSRDGSAPFTIKAAQEIVLCAGWSHTPQILQRSGVGPKDLLKKAGIPLVVDLPGVGSNLQDHPGLRGAYRYTKDVQPNPSSLQTNATFAAFADELWKNRKGPRSFGVGNSMVQAPLAILAEDRYKEIHRKFLAQKAKDVLPPTYTREQIRGWERQREVIAATYLKKDNSVAEIPFSGGASTSLILMRPVSRGTLFINTTDVYAEPVIDYFANFNPVDTDIAVATLRYYRKYMSSPAHQVLGPEEVAPGLQVDTDEELADYVAGSMGVSVGHSCCTAALGPRDLGGVVDNDLTVHGVTGLSVSDISAIPLVPATHTCATVYALAEKGADLIKRRHNPRIPPAQHPGGH